MQENLREEREIKRMEKNLNIKKNKKKGKSEEAATKVTGLRSVEWFIYILNLLTFDFNPRILTNDFLSSLFDDDGLNDILNFCEARPDLDTLRGEEEGEGEENVAQNESDSDNSDQEVSDQGLATLRVFLLFFCESCWIGWVEKSTTPCFL